MRILCLGSPLFAQLWREMGHTVLIVTDLLLPPDPETIRFDFFHKPQECASRFGDIVDSFHPDVIFQGDHSTPLIHCGLEQIDIPKIWYAIDTHLHRAWHTHYAPGFDVVFCAQKNMVPVLSRFQRRVKWLPLFCQRGAEFIPWQERSLKISFVGTLDAKKNPERARLFQELRDQGVSLYCTRGDYVPVYQASYMVVNQSVADDMNLRFFEGPGCGALLLTDRLSHSMNDILEEGVDFLAYEHGNSRDLLRKIEWVTTHQPEAEAMARRAHEKITAGHMSTHRARTVLDTMMNLVEPGDRPGQDPAAATCHLAWAYDHCSRLELPEPLTAFFKGEAVRCASSCRESAVARPWALLLEASIALDTDNNQLADSLITQIVDAPDDPDFRLRHSILSIELAVLKGQFESARDRLSVSLKEFPEAQELNHLNAMMARIVGFSKT
ncbi:MAG: glycosyltransferase [Chitinispirillaceae bacterium]|jgi:hypothetical protein|nr:glycosyltransferase [Chitinispirillaceae bacterium]